MVKIKPILIKLAGTLDIKEVLTFVKEETFDLSTKEGHEALFKAFRELPTNALLVMRKVDKEKKKVTLEVYYKIPDEPDGLEVVPEGGGEA